MTVRRYGRWQSFSGGIVKYLTNYRKMETRVVTKAAKLARQMLIKNIQSGGSLVGATFVPNTPYTIMMKGSSRPLIQDRILSSSGSYNIRLLEPKASLLTVRRMSSSGVELAGLHEEGNPGGGMFGSDIPARPHFKPVINSELLSNEIEEMARIEFKGILENSFGFAFG